jgi:uridine kinase
MLNSKIISIAGSSGVGKSTVAQLLCILLEDAYHLTGDNYHRWPRGDSNWKKYTHLNPLANDLITLHSHLTSLKSGSAINVKKYNHTSGTFDPEQEVRPHKYIISDGLHALYSSELCEISDLRIFVDTDEDLKLQWKLDRDVNERGYSRAQVLDAIKNRQPDEISYINPQKANADVVIKFTKVEDKIICVVEKFKCNEENTKIIENLVALYNRREV